MLFTIRGIPTIYYGTEIALEGKEEPDNRRDMRFGENPEITEFIKKLTRIRLSSEALKKGIQVQNYQDDVVYSFSRVSSDEQAIVVLNNSKKEETREIPLFVTPKISDGILKSITW